MADFNFEMTQMIPHLRRYARGLVNNREKADDLVQDCLERALSRRHLWNESRVMRPWLFTILHNIYANAARKFNRSPDLVSMTQMEESVSTDDGIDLSLSDLNNALDLLSQEHREIILLVGLEQMSYKETAEVLDIPLGTVMSRLTRARKKLRELMQGPTLSKIRRVK
jgi:RNA polymerase sigma-70 factor (ECF subfamily)